MDSAISEDSSCSIATAPLRGLFPFPADLVHHSSDLNLDKIPKMWAVARGNSRMYWTSINYPRRTYYCNGAHYHIPSAFGEPVFGFYAIIFQFAYSV